MVFHLESAQYHLRFVSETICKHHLCLFHEMMILVSFIMCLFIFRILFLCVCVLDVGRVCGCGWVRVCAQERNGLWEPEEGAGSSGAGIIGS